MRLQRAQNFGNDPLFIGKAEMIRYGLGRTRPGPQAKCAYCQSSDAWRSAERMRAQGGGLCPAARTIKTSHKLLAGRKKI
jgi:hypothetical protein